MKTTFNKLAAVVIFAFILLAGNVRAEGKDVTASSLENITETSLQLENWMTNKTFWNITGTLTIAVEAEAGLEMENWMTNDSAWEVNQAEVNLQLEDWMTNDSTWEVKHAQLSEIETSLQLEDWMTNNKIWNI